MKSHRKILGCPRSPGLPVRFPKNGGRGWSEKADREWRVPTNSWICHFDFQKKLGGGVKRHRKRLGCTPLPGFGTSICKKCRRGVENADRKLSVRTSSVICHFDFEKKLRAGCERGAQKGDGAHKLLDLHFDYQKMGGRREKVHKKFRVPTNSWICYIDFQKIPEGGVETADRKLRVPTNSWICHFDFQKETGRGVKMHTEKVEGAHELLDFHFDLQKMGGGCVKDRTES